jgi:glycogen operon protein
VLDPAFTWGDDRPPRTPWHKTVIYELHVKGFTQLNPFVPENLRGSYLYQDDGRKPSASINFITCHDGFTLADMVAYNEKHNEANGEENRDGANDNNSWNCGVEADADDPKILELRARQQRNLIATVALSVGVPMILGGDELSRSQKGNNNTYCQDNELNWLNWDLDERRQKFLEFVRKLILIRRTQPVFQRQKFFIGRAIRGSDVKDISFLNPSGQEMSDDDWGSGFVRCLGVRLAGDLINDETERGEPIVGETLLLPLNSHWEPIPLPCRRRNAAISGSGCSIPSNRARRPRGIREALDIP